MFIKDFPGGTRGKETTCQYKRHETRVRSLGQEDPLEEGMETHSSILAWRIPWTEEPGGLQSIGSQSLTWLKRLSTYARVHQTMLHPWYISWEMEQQWLTRPQLIIQQDCRLPTDLAAEKTSGLDSESIIMTQFQVGNFKEIISSIPKVSWDIHDTIKHVYLVALKTNTGGTAQEVKQGNGQLLLWVTTLYELLSAGTYRC